MGILRDAERRRGGAVPTMRCWARVLEARGICGEIHGVRPLREKAHKNCEDHRGSGGKRETTDLCSAHVAHLERDNNVCCIPTDCHNVAIAETPIIEAAELEQPSGNDPYRIKRCYHLPETAEEDGKPASNRNQDDMSSK
jgi:hypothetical protein